MLSMSLRHAAALSLVLGCAAAGRADDDFDRSPINYSSARPDNLVTRLQKQIDAGQVKLPFADEFGYLPAVLKGLNVPTSSQMLVFSKTSLQRDRISPLT